MEGEKPPDGERAKNQEPDRIDPGSPGPEEDGYARERKGEKSKVQARKKGKTSVMNSIGDETSLVQEKGVSKDSRKQKVHRGEGMQRILEDLTGRQTRTPA